MQKIKIGIGGAHSTGKTTFINRIKKELENQSISFKIIADLATDCREHFEILRGHTVESTLWIASKGINEEVQAGSKYQVIIADRSIIDCWAYFSAICKGKYTEHNPKLRTLESMVANWVPTYDLLYQTVIDLNFPVENDNRRDLDENFRLQIGQEMIEANKKFNITPKFLTSTNKDFELDFILKKIQEVLNMPSA